MMMTEVQYQQLESTGKYSPSADAVWSLLLAADYMRDRMESVCAEFDVTTSQFSVLRILRGVHPEGYSRTEIARRMIERAPDVTRLVDRLEQQRLVERTRSNEDRRLSVTRITDAGLHVLAQVEPKIQALECSCFAGSLTEPDCSDLLRLCRLIRSRVDFSRSRRDEEAAPWIASPFVARPANEPQNGVAREQADAAPLALSVSAVAGSD